MPTFWTLPSFWTLLTNRWRLMGLTVLAAVAVAGMWITSQTPLYTAKTVVLIELPQEPANNADADNAQDRYYQQQVDLLRSPEFASIVDTLEAEYMAARNTETLLQGEVEEQRKKALEAKEIEAVAALLTADVAAARALTENIRKQ